MGERAKRAEGHVSQTLGGDPSQGAEEAQASSGRSARRVAREDAPGGPSLERDPYQDEGGEG